MKFQQYYCFNDNNQYLDHDGITNDQKYKKGIAKVESNYRTLKKRKKKKRRQLHTAHQKNKEKLQITDSPISKKAYLKIKTKESNAINMLRRNFEFPPRIDIAEE